MSFQKKRVVCVEWEDASSNNGYYDPEYPDKTTTITTQSVGFLVEKNKKVVKLCTDGFEYGEFRHVHSIPKGMVRKITYLK